MTSNNYLPRIAERKIEELLGEFPAILLTGPRASGKTTTAMRFAKTVVRLDDPARARAFNADPDAALRGLPEPILLDEWQVVPGVMGAVKRSVDSSSNAGRFILTGSASEKSITHLWPGTGRITHVPMYPMVERELRGADLKSSFIDKIIKGETATRSKEIFDLRDYIDCAISSGFPEPRLHLTSSAQAQWLSSYLQQIATKDVTDTGSRRDMGKFRQFLQAYAINTAGIYEDKLLMDSAGISRTTLRSYEQILANLGLSIELQPWFSNQLKRLAKQSKRFVVDAAITANVMSYDTDAILGQGDVLGRVIETFVLSQLLPDIAASIHRPNLYHLRTEKGRQEIDLIVEVGNRIIAIEIKSSNAPSQRDARHIRWLHDELGENFIAGIVFHTGQDIFQIEEKVTAIPISSIWS